MLWGIDTQPLRRDCVGIRMRDLNVKFFFYVRMPSHWNVHDSFCTNRSRLIQGRLWIVFREFTDLLCLPILVLFELNLGSLMPYSYEKNCVHICNCCCEKVLVKLWQIRVKIRLLGQTPVMSIVQ